MRFKAAIPANRGDSRAGGRRKLRLTVELHASDGRILYVKIRNIADRGILLETADSIMAIGDVIQVDLPETGTVSAEVVWAAEPFFGCRLDDRLSGAHLAAALLKAEPTSYRLMQDGTPVTGGTLANVQEDPVPNFSKAFFIVAGFWLVVTILFFTLT
jgi:hypothetical protein